MTNAETKILGDNNVKGYQRFVLSIGILLILIFTIFFVVNWNFYYLLATVIIALFIAVLLILYSKVYAIEYDKSHFYMSNMFSKDKKENSSFAKIRHVKIMPFLYVACFKDKRYYFLVSSQEYYKNLFKSNKQYALELSEDIKEFISQL
jgi:c-di-AMP phosphodiesterase-like protein